MIHGAFATLLATENIVQFLPTLALGSLYARYAHRPSNGPHRISTWRQVCFYSAVSR
ncbi:MAG TPA: hypothetical protein VGI26_07155 [Solirubrobacteraceae bacterium]